MPVKCNKKALVTCKDCEDAGKKCVKQTGNDEKCKSLGWDSKTEKCMKCPDKVDKCDDCIQMGVKCISHVSFLSLTQNSLQLLNCKVLDPTTDYL